MSMTLEEKIQQLGYTFRDITYHSNGKYSCRLIERQYHIGRQIEFWGDTPSEALDQAIFRIKELERKEMNL